MDGVSFEIQDGRVLLHARPVRLGQDHLLAADRRVRAAGRRQYRDPWRQCRRRAALPARREHGIPGLRAVSAHDRGRERRVRADDPQGGGGRAAPALAGDARAGQARSHGCPQAQPALGRTAPARGAGARVDQPAERAVAGRAAGSARPQAARTDAGGTQGPAAPGRHHLHLRDPRPGRGAGDERPAGGVQPRPHRADRRARAKSTSIRRPHLSPASSAYPTSAPANWRAGSPDRRRPSRFARKKSP